MNYIKQVNQFYKLLPNNPLSSNAQCLYFYLLNKNNEFAWIKEFTIANSIICGFTSMNISALQRARNMLVQKGYIHYKKGHSNNAGYYSIIEFEQQNEQQDEQQSEQQNEQQNDNTTNTLNKQNKTKQKNIKKNNKKKFGEYENVLLDDEQYEKLKNDFPNDYKLRIQNLDDYIQSSGRKYKDHLATIRAWARKEDYKRPKDTESKQEYQVFNSEDMSEKDYLRLVRGG